MSILYLNWTFNQVTEESIMKYCPQCRRKVPFVDSNKRRHNANGKDIYQFAIFKCPNDHTWNKRLDIYKAKPVLPTHDTEKEFHKKGIEDPMVSVQELLQQGIHTIQIHIASVERTVRLDQALSKKILDLSRSQIQKLIKQGKIQVNSQVVPPKYLVRENDRIHVHL